RRRRYSERFERRVHDVAQYLRAPHAVDGRRYTAFDLPISRIALIERNELVVTYAQARRRLEIPFRKSIDRFTDTRVGSHCCKRRGSVGTLRVRESPQDERKQYLGVAHLYAALEMARIQYGYRPPCARFAAVDRRLNLDSQTRGAGAEIIAGA